MSPLPRPWEPLGSYLARSANYLGMGTGALMSWLGWSWESGWPLRGLSFGVDDNTGATIAKAFSREPGEIHAMTLRMYAGGLFAGDALRRYGLPPRATSAGCFSCLRDGRWDLRWSTTLVTVCGVHLTYLHWRCPRCDRPFGPDLRAPGGDEPPTAHGTRTRRCLGPQSPDARADVADIHASAVASGLLDDARSNDDAARRVSETLRFVRVLRDADHAPKTPAGVGEDAPVLHRADIATGLEASRTSATDAVHLPGVQRAVGVYVRRPEWPKVPPPLPRWADADRVGAVFEAAYAQARSQVVPVVVPLPGARSVEVEFLPACVPPELVTVRLTDVLGDIEVDENVRVLIAVAAAQQPGPGHWGARSATLDLSGRVASRAMALVQQLEAAGRDETFWEEIDLLRTELVNLGISFRARIAVLQDLRVHQHSMIAEIAQRHDLPAGAVVNWLVERWACHPLRLLASPRGTRVPRRLAPSLDEEFGRMPWRLPILELDTTVDAADSRRA
ncbi:MAG: hypothetical protein HGA44_00175 [Cellulomonadaceae bacterium]|nr:hypothetical protein [Cellulomonadaceae bacterium]